MLITSGDFDGDGYIDAAVVMPYADVNGSSNAGLVHVFDGSKNGITVKGDQVWTQDTSDVLDSCESQDDLGYSAPGSL